MIIILIISVHKTEGPPGSPPAWLGTGALSLPSETCATPSSECSGDAAWPQHGANPAHCTCSPVLPPPPAHFPQVAPILRPCILRNSSRPYRVAPASWRRIPASFQGTREFRALRGGNCPPQTESIPLPPFAQKSGSFRARFAFPRVSAFRASLLLASRSPCRGSLASSSWDEGAQVPRDTYCLSHRTSSWQGSRAWPGAVALGSLRHSISQ